MVRLERQLNFAGLDNQNVGAMVSRKGLFTPTPTPVSKLHDLIALLASADDFGNGEKQQWGANALECVARVRSHLHPNPQPLRRTNP